MDTHTVVSIVPAVMQAAQLRGAAVLDAAAFGARVLRSAVWHASAMPLESGPAAVLLGVCVCIVAPIMLGVFYLALARSAWAELPWSRRVFVASCTKDLLNAVTATPCALAALCGLLLGRPDASLSCTAAAAGAAGAVGAAAESSLLAQKLPAFGLVACGITCGFFAADCVVLWRHGDELCAEMGRTNTRLMWPHHLLSLVVWPYCAVYGRGGVFVLYFISTELSSVFLNLHVLATKGDVTPNAQCPMPNAQCPMPNAQCPMPNAQCPMPNAGDDQMHPANAGCIWQRGMHPAIFRMHLAEDRFLLVNAHLPGGSERVSETVTLTRCTCSARAPNCSAPASFSSPLRCGGSRPYPWCCTPTTRRSPAQAVAACARLRGGCWP